VRDLESLDRRRGILEVEFVVNELRLESATVVEMPEPGRVVRSIAERARRIARTDAYGLRRVAQAQWEREKLSARPVSRGLAPGRARKERGDECDRWNEQLATDTADDQTHTADTALGLL
jgi:hypothetical protein